MKKYFYRTDTQHDYLSPFTSHLPPFTFPCGVDKNILLFSTLFAADHASGNIKNCTSLDVIITLKTVNFIIY